MTSADLASVRATRPNHCGMTKHPLIKVMVVDDHPLVRVGIATVVNQQSDMIIVAEAEGGDRALELYRQPQPDVVLMDLRLRGDSGARLTGLIRAAFHGARRRAPRLFTLSLTFRPAAYSAESLCLADRTLFQLPDI